MVNYKGLKNILAYNDILLFIGLDNLLNANNHNDVKALAQLRASIENRFDIYSKTKSFVNAMRYNAYSYHVDIGVGYWIDTSDNNKVYSELSACFGLAGHDFDLNMLRSISELAQELKEISIYCVNNNRGMLVYASGKIEMLNTVKVTKKLPKNATGYTQFNPYSTDSCYLS